MGDLIRAASLIVTQATHRAEMSAQNIANVASSGYKKRVDFSAIVAGADGSGMAIAPRQIVDFSAGASVVGGGSYDLAIGGAGFFVVRNGDDLSYTRSGQFERDGNGHLVNAHGGVLQAEAGGDIVVTRPPADIARDGTILEEGAPIARIAVVDFEDSSILQPDAGGFTAPSSEARAVGSPLILHGVYEASNVATGDEMVVLMEALRRAETGQRLVQLYDELMGRALSAFGGNAA